MTTARRNTTNLPMVPAPVKQAAARVRQAGGKALLVGGAVIDILLGLEVKDWDIEVYGLSYDRIVSLFADCNPVLVGRAFGVVKAHIDGLDIDLSVPRRDNKIGLGHKGFSAALDPTMTVTDAARRRDFTINSMAVDLLTGEVYDPFDGQADLRAGILRATDPRLFVEDPLRALRAMQLLARKAKKVDPTTLRLIQSIVHTFPDLPRERVYEEFEKLLLKAKRPSVGLAFLRRSGWLRWFPELENLIGCPQNPRHHAEGDVWVHTLMVVDEAAKRRELVRPNQRAAFMFAALLHDVGKPATTVHAEHIARGEYPPERLHSAYGHDEAGTALAERFMQRLTGDKRLTALVCALVGKHMQPHALLRPDAGESAFLRLAKRMAEADGDLSLLALVAEADAAGRRLRVPGQPGKVQRLDDLSPVHDYARRLAEQPAKLTPLVLGRDLIALGVKPGPAMGRALAIAYEAQLDDSSRTKAELLQIALGALRHD